MLLIPKYIDAARKFELHEPRPVTIFETPAGTPHPTLIFGERGNEHTDIPKFESKNPLPYPNKKKTGNFHFPFSVLFSFLYLILHIAYFILHLPPPSPPRRG